MTCAEWTLEINDGRTIANIGALISWLWFAPGNLFIELLNLAPSPLTDYLGLGASLCSGVFSAMASLVIWSLVLSWCWYR